MIRRAYWYGNLDMSISRAYSQARSYFMQYTAVLTTLDSTPADECCSTLHKQKIQYELRHGVLFIESQQFYNMVECDKCFYGFDEVYFVRQVAYADWSRERGRFTADWVDLNECVPSDLISFMRALDISAFLSDGCCGLNYIVDDKIAACQLDEFTREICGVSP